jgi:ATP adenylyltransferase
MSAPTPIVPSLAALTQLLGNVLKQYESAVAAKSVNFYPSQLSIAPQDVAGPSKPASIAWTVRCVPALLDKEREKVAKKNNQQPDNKANESNGGKQQNSDDVFAPPYHPDLLVQELPEHTVLLNKFCVVPRHFLLVTREFEPQTLPPSPDSLAIAYRLLCAHQRLSSQGSPDVGKGKELLAFYNCGQASGASQPHQHMQFAELGGEDEVEASGGDDTAKHSVPVEVLLNRIVKDGKEEGKS